VGRENWHQLMKANNGTGHYQRNDNHVFQLEPKMKR
jgi:hypothetical protein